MLNVNQIRQSFKMFEYNDNLIYLDSAATSLTPNCVVEKMNDYYYKYRATVHRTKYKIGVEADNEYTNARQHIANFINAKEDEIIFTKGTTSSLNLLAKYLLKDLDNKDHVLISELDHHSNILPWREYNKDVTIDYVKLDDKNKITIDNFKNSLTENTKIVALNHVSNVIGDITPIKEIAKICRTNNIILVVDGAQAISHEEVDVKDLDVDYYVFSGHKMCGPTGIGVCYISENVERDIRFEYGGDMTVKVTKDSAIYGERPVGLEAGTPAIAEVIGLGQACLFLKEIGMKNINEHVFNLKKRLVSKLESNENITIYNKDSHSGLVSFNIRDVIKDDGSHYAAHDVLSGLEQVNEQICIRGGHMCNLLSLNLLNAKSALRASIYIYNDESDIDILAETLNKIANNEIEIIGDIF